MATYTSNYGWTKPSGSDQVNISVLNDNLDSQDSIMHDAFLNMAEPFSELSTYSVGYIVLYGTKTYKCHTPVVTPGSWTGSTNWDEYKLSEGGGASGGEVKNLDNGMLSHSTDSSYITVNLDVALTAGKEYKITLRDPAYNYVDTKQILWTSTVDVNFPGTGSSGEYKISLTQSTVSLYNYGGQGWRDIYCDIVSDFSREDYTDLTNKPSINGVELSGNKTASQLGMANSNTFQGTIAEWNALSAAEKKAYDHASIPNSVGGGVTFPANKVIMTGGENVEEVTEEKVDKSDIAPDFSPTKNFYQYDLCWYEGKLYEFTTYHAAGAWIGTDVQNKNVSDILTKYTDGWYRILKSVSADGVKTYKQLFNELFSGVNIVASANIYVYVSGLVLRPSYLQSNKKFFSTCYNTDSALMIRSLEYNLSTPANTQYNMIQGVVSTNALSLTSQTDTVPASGTDFRIYTGIRISPT